MAEFSIGAIELGTIHEASFGEFIGIVSGRSIVSGADWGGDRIELGLSGDAMIRVFHTDSGLHINLISTTNAGDLPSLMLELAAKERRLPLRVVEEKLRALRSLHAIVHLAFTDHSDVIYKGLSLDPHFEFDRQLSNDESLYLESLAPGSWYVTLWTKVRPSYRSLLSAVAMVYGRGREAILRKLEAEARIKELEIEEREFKLLTQRVDFGLALLDRIPLDGRDALRARVENEVAALLESPRGSSEVQAAVKHVLDKGS